ncbi:MAG: hypothetical protein U0974_05885 [Gemmatimonadales bacterium]|nr:hypothetical protein [Gemmatimonadales bacterium]
MFEILVESKPKQERTISETVISVVCHALLALATIQATRGGVAVVEDSIIQVPDFVLDQPPPPPEYRPTRPLGELPCRSSRRRPPSGRSCRRSNSRPKSRR